MSTDETVPRAERKNLLLRMLVEDMLEQVRELQRQAGSWPAEERRQAEEALERIMTQVRREAPRRGDA